MATVTSFTAARMAAIEAASIVSGSVVGDNLILTKHDGSTVNAGNVRGATGPSANVSNETWHTVGSAGEPAFVSPFVAYGGTNQAPAFQKDPSGIVRLRGLVAATTSNSPGATIFTLPVGYRPTAGRVFSTRAYVASTDSTARIDITNAGAVNVPTVITASGFISLEGISFDTDQTSWPAGAVQPIPLVSALPGSPVDGQEVYFQSSAMATAGVAWHIRYRSAASGSYKWEFIGGAPLTNAVGTAGTDESTTSTSYTDLTTVGPSVTVPLAGNYGLRFAIDSYRNDAGAGVDANISFALGATAASSGNAISNGSGQMIPGAGEKLVTLAASDIVRAKYAVSSGTGRFRGKRILTIYPIQVG